MPNDPVILLAEDLEEDVIIITRAFKEVFVPHKLFVVHSCEEVTRYLLGQGKYADRARFPFPSLLLLDLKMPGMEGFEVLQWLRSMPALNHLRVVVLTASDHIYDVNKAYALGANSFLVKPSDFENTLQLAKTLTQHWLVDSKAPSPYMVPPRSSTGQAANSKPARVPRKRKGAGI